MIDLSVLKPPHMLPISDRFAFIQDEIDALETMLDGTSRAQLTSDRHLPFALERMLEIISIAADHIPDDVKDVESSVDWTSFSEMSYRLKKACNRVDVGMLWNFVEETIPPLKACCQTYVTKP